MAFFFSSSKATKFRQERKRKIEEDFKEGNLTVRNIIIDHHNGSITFLTLQCTLSHFVQVVKETGYKLYVMEEWLCSSPFFTFLIMDVVNILSTLSMITVDLGLVLESLVRYICLYLLLAITFGHEATKLQFI